MSLLAQAPRLSTLAFGEKLQMPRKYFLISFTLSLQPSQREARDNQSLCEDGLFHRMHFYIGVLYTECHF